MRLNHRILITILWILIKYEIINSVRVKILIDCLTKNRINTWTPEKWA